MADSEPPGEQPPGEQPPGDDTALPIAVPKSRLQVVVSWIRDPRRGLVWAAAFILIAAGVGCLVGSDNGVTGWWQITLDAFGVGLIVGGFVDVLAISWLNKEQQKHNEQAQFVLDHPEDPDARSMAWGVLTAAGTNIDPEKSKQLLDFLAEEPAPRQPQDHGDAPQAPGNG